MAAETAADRQAFLGDDFGVTVRHLNGKFRAIFDNQYLLIDASMAGVESREPVLMCRTEDVADLKRGTVLEFNGQQFRVNRHEPDGTGMTVVRLEK